jgi:hypothetical protein
MEFAENTIFAHNNANTGAAVTNVVSNKRG